MALNSLYCADVPLSTYSPTHSLWLWLKTAHEKRKTTNVEHFKVTKKTLSMRNRGDIPSHWRQCFVLMDTGSLLWGPVTKNHNVSRRQWRTFSKQTGSAFRSACQSALRPSFKRRRRQLAAARRRNHRATQWQIYHHRWCCTARITRSRWNRPMQSMPSSFPIHLRRRIQSQQFAEKRSTLSRKSWLSPLPEGYFKI